MRVVLIHDWLLQAGGAEQVLAAFRRIWPEAPVYTLLADRSQLPESLADADIRVSYLDRWPILRRHHRKLLPLMPSAVEAMDLGDYDLIVSSSHCVAKGVLVRPGQRHLCYCHTPMRYTWDLQEEYLESAGLNRGLRGLLARQMLSRIRTWDAASATRVDQFLANSSYIAARVERSYGRSARVVHPPVDVEAFTPDPVREPYLVSACRLVRYKRVDLMIEAANAAGIRLVVFGSGPEEARLKQLAGPTVEMRGWAPAEDVQRTVARGSGFITAAREDFGISTAEALAAGVPVVGFAEGGTPDIVDHERTGLLFSEQTVPAITEAMQRVLTETGRFEAAALRRAAMRFSESRFRSEILDEVQRLSGSVSAAAGGRS